jgi:ferritin-like metal-binding protein YciE
MGFFSQDIETLEDLFRHGLQDIYYAENQILKTLPKLIDNASSPDLRKRLKRHLSETERQVSRLEQIFEMREEKPKGTKCYGINGLISEGDELTGDIAGKKLLDVGIIASALAVESYEITRYTSLIGWARQLGRNDFAEILSANLGEEEATKAGLDRLSGKTASSLGKGARRRPLPKGQPTSRRARRAKTARKAG